jgi:hypothetical protein
VEVPERRGAALACVEISTLIGEVMVASNSGVEEEIDGRELSCTGRCCSGDLCAGATSDGDAPTGGTISCLVGGKEFSSLFLATNRDGMLVGMTEEGKSTSVGTGEGEIASPIESSATVEGFLEEMGNNREKNIALGSDCFWGESVGTA